MTTAVSFLGNSREEKMAEASAATNVALGIPLAAAFSRANATDDSLTSTPATRSKTRADARANRPLPQ